jgi:hypothetical protein
MLGAAPVLKIIYSPLPVFVGGTHILAMGGKPSHAELVRALGAMTPDTTETLAWLHVLAAKPALVINNYVHAAGVAPCTMYVFDLYRHDHRPLLKVLGEQNRALLKERLQLASDEQLLTFLASL